MQNGFVELHLHVACCCNISYILSPPTGPLQHNILCSFYPDIQTFGLRSIFPLLPLLLLNFGHRALVHFVLKLYYLSPSISSRLRCSDFNYHARRCYRTAFHFDRFVGSSVT